jgi:general secretion pathway protein H
MRRRPWPPRRDAQAGYSLLEVLLTLAIIGAASTLVVAQLPAPEPTLAAEARTLAARLTLAGEEAVISGQPLGVDVDEAGYRFRRRVAGEWRAIADEPGFAPRAWPAGVTVEMTREGERVARARLRQLELTEDEADARASPVGRFDPTGAATALTVEISEGRRLYRIAVDVGGAVSLLAEGDGA